MDNIKIKMKPTSQIKARLGFAVDGDVQQEFTHICRKRMDKYLPKRDGNLAKSVIEESDRVIHHTIYARYLYYGKVMTPSYPIKDKNGNIIRWVSPVKPKQVTGRNLKFSSEKNPLATSRWDKVMWSAEKSSVIKELQRYVKNRKR